MRSGMRRRGRRMLGRRRRRGSREGRQGRQGKQGRGDREGREGSRVDSRVGINSARLPNMGHQRNSNSSNNSHSSHSSGVSRLVKLHHLSRYTNSTRNSPLMRQGHHPDRLRDRDMVVPHQDQDPSTHTHTSTNNHTATPRLYPDARPLTPSSSSSSIAGRIRSTRPSLSVSRCTSNSSK